LDEEEPKKSKARSTFWLTGQKFRSMKESLLRLLLLLLTDTDLEDISASFGITAMIEATSPSGAVIR
jgi:hypothetical protein